MDGIFRFLALLTSVFHPATTGCCSCRCCDRRLGGADVDDGEREPIKETINFAGSSRDAFGGGGRSHDEGRVEEKQRGRDGLRRRARP